MTYRLVPLSLNQSSVRGEHISSKVIIETTKAICEKLDLKIIAEGVETHTQLDFINQCGFDYCQGYFHYELVDQLTPLLI